MSQNSDPAALYRRELRDLAARMRSDKRLDPADATITCTSRVCGSSVTLDIRQQGGVITALGWRVRACTLGAAATAIVVGAAPGKSFMACADMAEALRRFLSGEDVTFPPDWQALSGFAAARTLKQRHGSILLPFDVLAKFVQGGLQASR